MTDAHLTRARDVIAASLVWDNHACMPLRPADDRFLPQIARARASGMDVISLNIGFGPQPLDSHIRMLGSFRRWVAARPAEYMLVGTVADIDRARATGRLGIFFDVEGLAPLDDGDNGLVQLLYDGGVRWMSIAYNQTNAAGGGCYDADDPGLTLHGRSVLAEMKRVGMIACCSHTGHRTAMDVIEHADNPVIFSHSNPASVFAHARNIPDLLIRACAASGGVIGINGIGPFLGDNDDRPETVADHIDHVTQLVGADHVGLGLDYVFDQQELLDYLATMRETFPDDASWREAPRMVPPESLPRIVEALFRRGYAESDVGKILGGNWRRVAEQVWR